MNPITRMISTAAIMMRNFTVFLSVPKIIGKGPIRIMPPPFVSSLPKLRNTSRINATIVMAMPRNIKMKPA